MRRVLVAIAFGVLALAGTHAAAQTTCKDLTANARTAVYVAGPNNSIACVLNWTTGLTKTVVTSDGGTNFTGLYALDQGPGAGVTLIAGSSAQSGSVQVWDCDVNGENCTFTGIAASFSQVLGVSLDTFGNLATVNGSSILYAERCTPVFQVSLGGTPALVPDTGCSAAGFATAAVPQSVPGVAQPTDVRFVTNAIAFSTDLTAKYQPGDVLVLGPTQIVAFRAADLAAGTLGNYSKLVASLPAGSTGKGLALFPKTGEILVATNEGRLLVFDRKGALQSPDFASLGGRKGVQVSIANANQTVADPANGAEVYVTTNANGMAMRFFSQRQNSGKLVAFPSTPDSFATGNPPYGIGSASLTDSAWTATGKTTINPAKGQEILITNVRASGFTQTRAYLITGLAPGGTITGDMVGLPSTFSRVIPAYAQPMFRNVNTPESPVWAPYYLVYVTSSGADVYGSTQQHHLDTILQKLTDGSCGAGEVKGRLFYATDHDDPAIIESDTFIDITSGCGTHLGRGGSYSLFLPAGPAPLTSTSPTLTLPGDTRPLGEIVGYKLTNLRASVTGTDPAGGGLNLFIKSSVANAIVKDIDNAQAAYTANNKTAAQAYVDDIIATVNKNQSTFKSCVTSTSGTYCRNTPGEIIARATSAGFMVCGADPTFASCSKYKLQ